MEIQIENERREMSIEGDWEGDRERVGDRDRDGVGDRDREGDRERDGVGDRERDRDWVGDRDREREIRKCYRQKEVEISKNVDDSTEKICQYTCCTVQSRWYDDLHY